MNYLKSLTAMSSIASRLDGWINYATGFGTGRDRTQQSFFVADAPLWPAQCAPLYNGSSTVRKIVALPVEEAWREGVKVKCSDPAWAKRVHAAAHELGVFRSLFDAQVWGRLFGGGLVWIGVNDGLDPRLPLAPRRIRSLDFLEVFDPRFAMPKGRHMLFPDTWLVWGVEGGSAEVHHSRMIRFGGAHTDDLSRRGNRGWDFSILQALLSDIQAFDEAFHSAGIMLSDASQSVIKLKGLIAGLAGKDSGPVEDARRATRHVPKRRAGALPGQRRGLRQGRDAVQRDVRRRDAVRKEAVGLYRHSCCRAPR
jgi:hypothetical protein